MVPQIQPPDEITAFDIALYAIEGARTLLWPKPHLYLTRLDAMHTERPADDERPQEGESA